MEILITKFKIIENVRLKIPVTISGGNKKGKTTFLESISFCKTGKDLNGKPFESLYDNRKDLKSGIADVSIFDNYGNEYRRVVSPVFGINKVGDEVLITKYSTKCYKNSIEVKDFASDFIDFYIFGTNFIFCQNESTQREIFINSLIKFLPGFDLKKELELLKTFKKSEKNIFDRIKFLNLMKKELDKFSSDDYISVKSITDNFDLEIKQKQKELLDATEKTVNQDLKISNFYSTLSDKIFSEFSGDIKITVKLKEQIITTGEYSDCFKIYADENLFPSECNGALQNNVKMQILYNLQRLKCYTGITVMDNCEANTTQPINAMGLNCVLAFATNDELLTIK